MSLGEIVLKIVAIVFIVVGFALILSLVGINFLGVSTPNVWITVILGFVFLGLGIYLLRGGNVSL